MKRQPTKIFKVIFKSCVVGVEIELEYYKIEDKYDYSSDVYSSSLFIYHTVISYR